MPPGPVLAMAVACALAGCATPRAACPPPRLERFAALVPLGPDRLLVALGPARFTVGDVAYLAATGDKRMQYELARRLEAGDGVPADPARAEDLYAAAATFTSGQTAIYAPPVCKKCAGTVMFIRTGPDIPGLPEAGLARARMHLEGRAAKPNIRRALKWVRALAKSGYAPAVELETRLAARRA